MASYARRFVFDPEEESPAEVVPGEIEWLELIPAAPNLAMADARKHFAREIINAFAVPRSMLGVDFATGIDSTAIVTRDGKFNIREVRILEQAPQPVENPYGVLTDEDGNFIARGDF